MSTVEDLLQLETDGSCAVCGAKDSRVLTVHHLVASEPKDEAYDNKLLLCHNCHCCHHQGKGPTSDDLWKIKQRLIIKTLTRPGLNALKEAYRRGGVIATPFLVNHLVELGFLEIGEELSYYSGGGSLKIVTDVRYSITGDGVRILEKWRLG